MPIERGVGRAGVEVARLHPIHPGILRQPGDIAGDVGPSLASIASELNVAVIRADPNESLLLGRFADGINRGMHFRRRIVHGDAAGLFLLLLLRIIRGEVRRDAFPVLAVVA